MTQKELKALETRYKYFLKGKLDMIDLIMLMKNDIKNGKINTRDEERKKRCRFKCE